ncbi:hypothetical protein HU200_032373 [Digitaria exilis]|uniref:Bifunctional inhibitor/plant lipid transfer protein/seed storage helical domain-containing protein n=1 Tax=Digitaria exilis TaxID=1010633 RepID=A0A835EPP4_9POAL|nr:hypothetical protein HU200_032373 [Digitaria exilis]
MATKGILQAMVFALVFIILSTHQACGEEDCYRDKKLVLHNCKSDIAVATQYVPPSLDSKCCHTVQESKIVCVCRTLAREDEGRLRISAFKLASVAKDCGKPVPSGNNCGSMDPLLFILLKNVHLHLVSNY